MTVTVRVSLGFRDTVRVSFRDRVRVRVKVRVSFRLPTFIYYVWLPVSIRVSLGIRLGLELRFGSVLESSFSYILPAEM